MAIQLADIDYAKAELRKQLRIHGAPHLDDPTTAAVICVAAQLFASLTERIADLEQRVRVLEPDLP